MTKETNPGGGLIGLFATNTVASNLLMVGLLVGGLIVMMRMNAEVFPEIDPRTITINVAYPGATPGEIEQSVTRRAEEAVLGLEGVDRVTSSATEGSGRVTVELNDFVDAQSVKDDVQSAIDQLADFPPANAEEPEVEIASTVSNVMRLVITGDVGERTLRQAAETLERDLLSAGGVSVVTLQGARNYEISIEVPEATLREYDISIGEVAAAIRTASVNLSAGTIRTTGGDILLRTDEEARDAEAFGSIVIIRDFEGRRVLLRDIAAIVDGFEENPLVNTYNGKPAVFIQIDRSGDEDAFDVAAAVKDFLKSHRPPAGVEVIVASDDTERIRDRINLLARNAIMGLALVFVFLALTLDLRLAFWTSVGIPVAFLGGFMIFGQFTTLNMLTLFGLIMVLGIVVDDAIVVGENIYERQASGSTDTATAIEGARGVFAPVVVGVLDVDGGFRAAPPDVRRARTAPQSGSDGRHRRSVRLARRSVSDSPRAPRPWRRMERRSDEATEARRAGRPVLLPRPGAHARRGNGHAFSLCRHRDLRRDPHRICGPFLGRPCSIYLLPDR